MRKELTSARDFAIVFTIACQAAKSSWEESTPASVPTIFAVDILRALATTSATAAGKRSGLFVRFPAIGDVAGRVFAPSFQVPNDLPVAARAAGRISGGYHLPFTVVAMVLGQGGNHLAMLTCFTTAVVAGLPGTIVASLVGHSYIENKPEQLEN
jgi:H+/Cl- antiporter ClcA